MPFFTDGKKDLEGIQRSEDIKHIKQLRFMSRLIDGWAKRSDEGQLYRYTIVILLTVSFVGGIIYLRNKIGIATTFDLGHQYISVFMIAVSITHIAMHKLCHWYTMCILTMAIGAFLLFNIRPVANNFSAGAFTNKSDIETFETSLSYAFPFDYERNVIYYVGISIFNCYVSGSCLSYFVIIDTLISIMVFHLWGHIKILTNDLEIFVKSSSKPQLQDQHPHVGYRFSEQGMETILEQLRQHIKHHNLIINFLSRMSETFGGVLLVHYAFLQVSGCLMLLMCSPMDSESFARYGPLTLYCFQQLIQSSIIFELLDSSNDALTYAIYNLPWEEMKTNDRKIVYLMLLQSQRPMKLKAMDMITVGVQTMITILKTSLSYFLMIKTFAEN